METVIIMGKKVSTRTFESALDLEAYMLEVGVTEFKDVPLEEAMVAKEVGLIDDIGLQRTALAIAENQKATKAVKTEEEFLTYAQSLNLNIRPHSLEMMKAVTGEFNLAGAIHAMIMTRQHKDKQETEELKQLV